MELRRKDMRRRENGTARYCTFSCYQRLQLLGTASIRDAYIETLAEAQSRFGFELIAWVVMPEHVHLLVLPRSSSSPLSATLAWMKGVFAQRAIGRWRDLQATVLPRITRANGERRFWQAGGGYDRNIYSRDELVEKINYIHWNPVERELVREPRDWRWSSFSAYQGTPHLKLVITRHD
jgi:putative transposase